MKTLSTLHPNNVTNLSWVLHPLVEKFGPMVAELILQWLLSQKDLKPLASGAAAAPFSTSFLRSTAARLLREHKAEVLAFVNEQLSVSYDAVCDTIEGQ